jgi:peptidyl-prolyl cis-trans isomerase SurA
VKPEKKRFDRHGYVADTSAPAAAPVATASTKKPAKPGRKPQKTKREKVRFGQAPRETLPSVPGGQIAALPTQVGTAQGTTSMVTEALPDPNAAAAVTEDQDPLGPHAGPKKKTRYAQHPEAPKAPKPKLKPAPVAVAPPTETESAAEKVQAAPLGLNGDTAKKKKKDKTRHKGPKERLTEPAPVAPAKPVAPTTDVPVVPPAAPVVTPPST